jgi:hypothetical protein
MARSSFAYIPDFSVKSFWLKIEQFWPFEEISIFSNSGHLEWRAGLSDTILKGCKLEKKGDEIFKKSSPRKLLSQYQPNFAEMILGWTEKPGIFAKLLLAM